MKNLKMYILFSILFNALSCQSQDTSWEKALKKCINESVNKNIKEAFGKEPFDFYDFVLIIENELLERKLLNNNHKQSYLNLINMINGLDNIKFREMYHKQKIIINEFGFFAYSPESIFNQCPYKISVNGRDGEGKLIYKQGSILNDLMAQGYNNKELLSKLISCTDDENFSKIVYRAPVILLTMISLDFKYSPDIKKLREFQKKYSKGN